MKKLLLILFLLPVIGFSQLQNSFTGVQKILDTLKIGENGASHIGVLQLYGNGSGNLRLQTLAAAGTGKIYLYGNDGDTLISYRVARTLAGSGGSSLVLGSIDHYAGNANGAILSNDTLYMVTFTGASETPGLVPPSANEGKFLKDNGTWIDLATIYQTLANLSTNTSLGTSNTLYPSQLAVKTYVDNTAATIVPKASVIAATTGAGTLASSFENGDVIDGITLATGNRILIKNQASSSENGIYTVNASGTPTRATDFDAASEIVVGAETFVQSGTANAGTKWTQNAVVVTVNTDPITFVQTGGASGVAWGAITGTLSSQTDLNTALSGKVATTVTVNGHALSSNVTVTPTDLDANVSSTEYSYLDGVSSAIQTQLNGKQASGSYAASGANTDITSVLLSQTGLKIKGGDANALNIKANETLTTGRVFNLITHDADRTIDLSGNITTANSFTTSGNFALTLTASNTTNVTLPTSGTLSTLTGTETLANKRITPRTGTVASSATPTINTDNVDYFSITALAANITSMTTNLSGTPADGQLLTISFLDNGTARAIAWGTSFEDAANVSLPIATVISTRLDVDLFWNTATSKWRIIRTSEGAQAGNLTGTTLKSTVTASSLTSFGSSPTIVTPSITTGFTIGGAATSRKIIVGNGTNFVASTETWAVPGTSGNHLVSDGTNWTAVNERNNWTSLVVSGSNYTNGTTGLTDITGLVSGTLATATLYEFEAVLYVNSSSTAGVQLAAQQTGTGSGQIGVWSGTATSATATGITIASNSLGQAGAACVLVNGDGTINIRGFIKTGSSGSPTIKLQMLKTTSGTATVLIGSVMRFRVAN